jgi:hypothetical protein
MERKGRLVRRVMMSRPETLAMFALLLAIFGLVAWPIVSGWW